VLTFAVTGCFSIAETVSLQDKPTFHRSVQPEINFVFCFSGEILLQHVNMEQKRRIIKKDCLGRTYLYACLALDTNPFHLQPIIFFVYGTHRTGFNAFPTSDTMCPVKNMTFCFTESMTPLRTYTAVSAADTLGSLIFQFRLSLQSFRIVAPETTQRTPLQKHIGADTRSVMN
jgi:hypothetical protein